MILQYTQYRADGIFGQVFDEDGNLFCLIGTHAYEISDGIYCPKTPAGTYTCLRGQHRLASMDHDFTTFEVMNVPEFEGNPVSGILMAHPGNWPQIDSAGCFLPGDTLTQSDHGLMLMNSKATFAKFMAAYGAMESFQLTIKT